VNLTDDLRARLRTPNPHKGKLYENMQRFPYALF
jgi:hypothetical protein